MYVYGKHTYMYVHMCMGTRAHASVHAACIGLKLMLSVFFDYSPDSLLKQRLSLMEHKTLQLWLV